MKLQALVVGLLIAHSAQAEIPVSALPRLDFRHQCITQQVAQQNSDGVIQVVSGVFCHTLYADLQFLEVLVENHAYEKTFYATDWCESYDLDRHLNISVVSNVDQMGDGRALYVGQSYDGRDRFVVQLTSSSRPEANLPVDLYVQMNGVQYQTTGVRMTR